jgi:hypothetical protein
LVGDDVDSKHYAQAPFFFLRACDVLFFSFFFFFLICAGQTPVRRSVQLDCRDR